MSSSLSKRSNGPRSGHRNNQAAKPSGRKYNRKVFAGRNQDLQQLTSISNPWTPYTLPRNWVPRRVGEQWVDGTAKILKLVHAVPEEERAKVLELLKHRTHNTFARVSMPSSPRMWDGLVTARSVERARAAGEDVGKVAFAPSAEHAGDDKEAGEKTGGGVSARAKAVVIDTESVETGFGTPNGRSSLAKLGVVDFLTGEVLLDVLVLPDFPVTTWRYRSHGLNSQSFHRARSYGNLVQGVKGAQELLFQIISRETIVVGHSLMNDQRALYLAHDHAYDTQGMCRYKKMTMKLEEAAPEEFSEYAHCPVADALATRELAFMFLGLGKHNPTDRYVDWDAPKIRSETDPPEEQQEALDPEYANDPNYVVW